MTNLKFQKVAGSYGRKLQQTTDGGQLSSRHVVCKVSFEILVTVDITYCDHYGPGHN
jgi:hypothetical protein